MPPDPAAHLAATLKWLHPQGDEVFEVRIINPAQATGIWEGRAFGGDKKIVAGWFRDRAQAVKLIGQIKAEGIYVTLNPCQESLLARVHERLKANAKPTTSDQNIAARRNLLFDFDPQRPAAISSTDNEHETAILFAQQVKAELTQAGWPAPLVGDSGNGAHLVYAIELDNTPETAELLKAVLGSLAQRYAEQLKGCGLDVDLTVFNASRISKVYGTRTGKGDNLPDRPHRFAKILELPAERQPVSLKMLQDLAAAFTPAASGGSGGSLRHSGEEKGEGVFDLAAYLDHYGRAVVEVKPQGSAQLYVLEECVFDASHGRKDAAIGQAANGKLFYQCFHNSCQDKTWAQARELISGGHKLGQFMIGAPVPAKKKANLRVVGGGKAPAAASQGSQEPPPEDPATAGLTWSDLGNARRLVALHGQDLRFNHLNKEWYFWTGKVWRVDDCGEAVRRAKATVENIYAEAQELEWNSDDRKNMLKFALRSEAAGKIVALLQLAQSEPDIPILPAELDANPWLFNAANGTIDLRTGMLQEHRREDLLTCISPVAYDPDAECPLFEKFLFEIMRGDQDQDKAIEADHLAYFLQLSFGYSLTGICREQCFWIFWGSGSNGKGTLMDCVTDILGSYHSHISTETILAKDNAASQIRSDVARLDGPRWVTAEEIDKGRRLSESLVKGMTGQDTITARFLYGKDFDFKPQFKLFVQTNNKPIIRDLTNAMWRRLKLVEFAMDFRAKPDKSLPEKLRAEQAGILAWMVRGCLAWQKYGDLAEPESVKQAVQDYRDQMDPLKEFMEAKCLSDDPEMTATAADLYGAYTAWAEDNLTKKERLTKRAFGLALAEKGFRNGKGSGGVRLWRGLGLRTPE